MVHISPIKGPWDGCWAEEITEGLGFMAEN